MNYETPISEILRILLDRNWHSLYEIHVRFRLSPIEIYEAVIVLQRIGIIEWTNTNIRIKENLNEKKLSIMNRLSKTTRPSKLNTYTPNY